MPIVYHPDQGEGEAMTKADILMIKGVRKVDDNPEWVNKLPRVPVVIIYVSPWYKWSKTRMKRLEATVYNRMAAFIGVEYRVWWW
jgi:hypothetical protein